MGQLVDDTKLTAGELTERVPEYVVRLICGATIKEQWVNDDLIELASDGSIYQLRKSTFELITRVKDEVVKLIAVQGLYPPFSAENIIQIGKHAQWVMRGTVKIAPHKLRVLFPYDSDNGCTFYRILQPCHWLEKNSEKSPVHAEVTTYIKIGLALGEDFDAVVVPRPSNNISQMMRDIAACGKVVIYETDDLLTDIPDFNPAKMLINANEWHYALIQRSHGRIVSTEQLGEALQVVDNTHVVHNGIDPEMWRMSSPEQLPASPEHPVRILWAGGNTHAGDLKMVVDPIRRLIKQHGSKLQFVFVGYMPEEFQDRNSPHHVAQAWQRWVQYAPPVKIWSWPAYLAKANCHMAMAPLVKHPFNESKSEIKVLEAWALGIPIVCSNVAPYQRAITEGVDGYLVNGPIEWEAKLTNLILNHNKRAEMGVAGLASLKAKGYLMPDNVLNMERALLKICKGRVGRPECEAAIAARLQEIGG
jgi:glycosyltransferase involved in cell wall biosynthesis